LGDSLKLVLSLGGRQHRHVGGWSFRNGLFFTEIAYARSTLPKNFALRLGGRKSLSELANHKLHGLQSRGAPEEIEFGLCHGVTLELNGGDVK
jgi:hypothetical protein